MGQPITVTVRPGVRNDVRHFEINRSLTGMQTHRYRAGEAIPGTKPPDELARRLFALGVEAVTIYSSVVTVVAPGVAGEDRAGQGGEQREAGGDPQGPDDALVPDPRSCHRQASTMRMVATTMRTAATARRTIVGSSVAWRRAPSRPPRRLPAMIGPAWVRLMRPWAAKTSRAAADVIPTVNVVVAAATLTGTRMISLVAGVLMNPPLAPAMPATSPASDIAASPTGRLRAR